MADSILADTISNSASKPKLSCGDLMFLMSHTPPMSSRWPRLTAVTQSLLMRRTFWIMVEGGRDGICSHETENFSALFAVRMKTIDNKQRDSGSGSECLKERTAKHFFRSDIPSRPVAICAGPPIGLQMTRLTWMSSIMEATLRG